MRLCLSQLCHRIILLLLLSNLLLWESATASHHCAIVNGRCQMTLEGLFVRARTLANYINALSSDAINDFYKKYDPDREFQLKVPMICHTSSLNTPLTKEQAQQMQPEALLKMIITILSSWTKPLQHLVTEMGAMQDTSDAMLSKIRKIDEKVTDLLEGMTIILSKVFPEAEENEDEAVLSGLIPLQTADEDSRLFAFYSQLRCLSTDSHKVGTFIMFLRCKLVHNSKC